jgi:hypothetical protein
MVIYDHEHFKYCVKRKCNKTVNKREMRPIRCEHTINCQWAIFSILIFIEKMLLFLFLPAILLEFKFFSFFFLLRRVSNLCRLKEQQNLHNCWWTLLSSMIEGEKELWKRNSFIMVKCEMDIVFGWKKIKSHLWIWIP